MRLFLSIYLLAQISFASTSGLFLDVDAMSDSYYVYDEPSFDKLRSYIDQKSKSTESYEVTSSILEVSKCFQIDATIFSSLIRKESSFNEKAVSPTGAAGLTQMTSIALKEIGDQLGIRGKSYADYRVTSYLKQQVTKCFGDVFLGDLIEIMSKHSKQIKEVLKKDIFLSTILGGILLKVTLSRRAGGEIKQVYKKSLEAYNGDVSIFKGEVMKVYYAKKIMSYAKELDLMI